MILVTLFVCTSGKPKCTYPVSFQVAFIEPGTQLQLELGADDFIESFEIEDGFYMGHDKRLTLLKNYCSQDDSIKIRCTLNNSRDTTFYIDQSKVKICFIGTNLIEFGSKCIQNS
jgi:hypothetical protein